MGWASYQEDNMDARGESKSRKPTVQSGKDRLKERHGPNPKTRYVPEDDICFESFLNSLAARKPKPSRPIPKGDIDARGESKQPKTLQSKPSSKTHRKKRQAPVTKIRYVSSDEIQLRIQREIIRQEKERETFELT